jgi:hypothetical protein
MAWKLLLYLPARPQAIEKGGRERYSCNCIDPEHAEVYQHERLAGYLPECRNSLASLRKNPNDSL